MVPANLRRLGHRSRRAGRVTIGLAAGAVLLGAQAAAALPPAGTSAGSAQSTPDRSAFAPVTDRAADSDHDGLLDAWETDGYDADGDGEVDVDLPALGADPEHKDVFVEMDYMGAEKECPCYLPKARTLDRIVEVFADSPRAHNPDGTDGIRLHLDAGSGRTEPYDLGGGNLVPLDRDLNPVTPEFDAIKAANFDPARASIFHYMVWAHGFDGGGSSGFTFGIPSDSFVVTLAAFPHGGTADAKLTVFMHELGHNLGLGHGGPHDNNNYKPNYLSVMGYAFSIDGVPRTGKRPNYYGYSTKALPVLVEGQTDERWGLRDEAARTYHTAWFCPDGEFIAESPGSAADPLDWNCNGSARDEVTVDLNGDGLLSILEGWRDWGHLVYDGGTIGAGASETPSGPPPVEITAEEYAARSAGR